MRALLSTGAAGDHLRERLEAHSASPRLDIRQPVDGLRRNEVVRNGPSRSGGRTIYDVTDGVTDPHFSRSPPDLDQSR
jgi:hypothetical protein